MIVELRNIIKKGFLHIFSATFANKIIQFGITIILVRILSKDLFGSFSYAQNILNLFLLLEGLGTSLGILQYCSSSKNEEEKLSYFRYGIKVGIIANFTIFLGIVLFSLTYKLPIKDSNYILISMSVLPIIWGIYEDFQSYLRANIKNKEYSILTVINSVLYLAGNIYLGIYLSVNGIVLSRYLAFIFTCILGIYMLKETLLKIKKTDSLSHLKKVDFLRFSITASFTNAISQMLYLIDTFLVGIIIGDSGIVASYKSATLIPFNLTFVPISVMIFIYPYFAKHFNDKVWIKKIYLKLLKWLSVLNAIISILLFLCAPIIIKIVFGEQYLDCVNVFRILAIGFFISATFRIPAGNILFSIQKVKINLYNSILSGVANIILDIVLIKYYGAIGAAIATCLVFIISSVFANVYICKYIKF